MSQVQNNEVGVMRIFACGGGGINIASKFAGNMPLRAGIADIRTVLVDTSRSNLHGLPADIEAFILPDLDGSGKVRSHNVEPIAKVIPRLLVQHEPGDLNLVVYTASGGTGSVAGPLLVDELLARDCNVISIVIGTEESDVAAENTFNTLKSLEAISNERQKPVHVHYTLHSADVKRSEADKEAIMAISSLAYLSSRQNDELDSMDLYRWLHYHTVPRTNLDPQLTLLKVYANADDVVEKSPETISLASLLKSRDEGHVRLRPAYGCVGYYRSGVEAPYNLFFASETAGLSEILNHLQKTAKDLSQHKAARTSGPSFLGNGDKVVGRLVL